MYVQVRHPQLVVSCMCAFTAVSVLFLLPPLYLYYQSALEIYTYEKADGFGQARDLVIQGFVRFVAITTIPVATSAIVLYLMVHVLCVHPLHACTQC